MGKVDFLKILPKIIGKKNSGKKIFWKNFFFQKIFFPVDFSLWFFAGSLKNQLFPNDFWQNVPIYSKIKKILCCITLIVFIHFLGKLQNFLNSFSLLSWFKKWFSKPLPLLGPAALEVEKCFLNHILNLDNREKVFSKFP